MLRIVSTWVGVWPPLYLLLSYEIAWQRYSAGWLLGSICPPSANGGYLLPPPRLSRRTRSPRTCAEPRSKGKMRTMIVDPYKTV